MATGLTEGTEQGNLFPDTPMAREAADVSRRIEELLHERDTGKPLSSLRGELTEIRNWLQKSGALHPHHNASIQWNAPYYEYGEKMGTYDEYFLGELEHYYLEEILPRYIDGHASSFEEARALANREIEEFTERIRQCMDDTHKQHL